MAAFAAGGDGFGADSGRRIRPPRRSCCRWCRTISLCRGRRGRRTRPASPRWHEVKPTGMLGPASLKGCTISPVRRWKRLMSPQGVCHLPKSAASLSEAAASACSSFGGRGGDGIFDRSTRGSSGAPPRRPPPGDGSLRPRRRPAKWGRNRRAQRRSQARSSCDLARRFWLSGIAIGQCVPGFDERGHGLLEPG